MQIIMGGKMSRNSFFAVFIVFGIASLLQPLSPAQAENIPPPQRGIAVLSSSIGSDYSPEALAEFVRRGNFSPVVIDWAWITAHWEKTDFPALNRFIQLMVEQGVPVAAMYRPRFLNSPTVPIQVDAAGKPATSHGYYICFSSPEARRWGISWGGKILQKCPQINEVISYNPLNQCQCPTCRAAAEINPYARYDGVWKFMAEAKAAWQKQNPNVKLGVVFVSDIEFWKRGAQIVDAAHPFLFIIDNTDFSKDAAAATAIRNLLPGKAGSCLAKITWGPTDKVSPARLAEFDRTAAQAGLPYFFWTVETMLDPKLYDRNELNQALTPRSGSDAPASPAAAASASAEPGNLNYSQQDIQRISAQGFLDRMRSREPGYQQFAALQALIQKAKDSNAAARGPILSLVITTMNDQRKR